MKPEILTYIALVLGSIGVIMSIVTLITKKRAEKKLETLLRDKKKELDSIKSIGRLRNELAHTNRVLTYDEFSELQEKIKKLLVQLDNNERNEILESLEQKSIKGQIDYLNKIIRLSGSTENIIIQNEK
jgi:uncharacterized membrane protein